MYKNLIIHIIRQLTRMQILSKPLKTSTLSVKQNSKQLFLSNFHIIKNGLILLLFNKLQQDSFSFIHNFSFWNQEFIL